MTGKKNATVVFDVTKLKSAGDKAMAEKAKVAMMEILSDQFEGEKGSSPTLNICFKQCTEGSRWGRICCGEVGIGWVVLECEWSIKDGTKVLKKPDHFKLRNSGAAGTGDLCDSDLGENILLTEMCRDAANKITREAKPALP